MKKISKLTYLLGLPALIGLSLLYSMNVAVGEISISIPSSMNLHRPQLWSLVLGSTGTQAIVEVNTGKNVLTIRNGLIMGRNNGSLQGARYVSIGGGVDNTISSVENSGIGGGNGNLVDSAVSVIGGGSENRVKADSKFNTVAGGYSNLVANEGSIVGGENNVVIGRSVVVGGSGNHVDGDGSMAFGSESKGGARSFSWNSPVVKDYSAIIVATGGVLIGTYEPVTGVNLVVEGAVKIGTGLLTGNVGEIRMQSGCFYGYDGSSWHVINKQSGEGCPKVVCAYGSVLLSPGDSVSAYTRPYAKDCSQMLVTGYCYADGTFGNPGVQYYPYCYNLSGGVRSDEDVAECGAANRQAYVNSPVDGLCNHGDSSPVVSLDNVFSWTCTIGTSVKSCAMTRVYSCNGDQPVGPGVILGNSVQVYSDTLKSWTPVAQGVSPGVCQWTCEAGYSQSSTGCEYVGGEINLYLGDLDMYFITDAGAQRHYTLMDRNLGAIAYMDEPGKTTGDWYGSYYQWGNNYGFPNQGPVSTSTTRVNASEYGPGTPLGYYSSDTFIKVSMSPFRWDSSNNSNLWGNNGSESNRQGPCPDGYHVPTDNEFLGMIDNWKKSENYTNTNFSSQWSLDFLMPLAGYRDRDTSSVNYQGTQGYYWSSTAYNLLNNGNAYNLNFSSSILQTQSGYGRALGFSVRCFRNSPTPSLTLYPDGGKKAVITVHNGKIRKLGTPTKSGKTFGGWYSDAGFTSQVHEGDSVPSSAELYAKWR